MKFSAAVQDRNNRLQRAAQKHGLSADAVGADLWVLYREEISVGRICYKRREKVWAADIAGVKHQRQAISLGCEEAVRFIADY